MAATDAISFSNETRVSKCEGRMYRAYHRGHGLAIRLYTPEGLAGLAAQAGWRIDVTHEVWPYTLVARLSLATT